MRTMKEEQFWNLQIIAQEIRHASDYDEFYIASREETEKQIACAEELLAEVQQYLESK